MLNAIFCEVLGTPTIDDDASFFASGGHSLLATRLVARVRSRLGAELDLATIYSSPTVRGLAARLDTPEVARPTVRRTPYGERPRVSAAQQRLWFLDRLHGSNSLYNMTLSFRISGPLREPELCAAIRDVVRRHEVLRTLYPMADGRVRPLVIPPGEPEDLVLRVDVDEADVAGRVQAEAAHHFDLGGERPLRAVLMRMSPEQHLLCITIHHIACDGWSIAPLCDDLGAAYRSRVKGTPGLGTLDTQYADFADWQAQLLTDDRFGEIVARQTAYWQEQLTALPTTVMPALSSGGPRGGSLTGDEIVERLGPDEHETLLHLAIRLGVSPFMIVHAALAVMMHHSGAGDDIVIGTPTAGRPDAAFDKLVGFFVNTAVLRLRIAGDPTFEELVLGARVVDLAAFGNQDIPFDHVVRAMNPQRASGENPLFRVMLAYQNTATAILDLGSLEVREEHVPLKSARFDLRFEFVEEFDAEHQAAGVTVRLNWSDQVTDRDTAEGLLTSLLRVLRSSLANPGASIDATSESREKRAIDRRRLSVPRKNAFVFAPFGQQWPGMGRQMFEGEPQFRGTIEECDSAFAVHSSWSLTDHLFSHDSAIDRMDVGQPLVFAVQLALFRWLGARGVTPDVVIGHSVGEIAAFAAAGVIDVDTACRIVFHYSKQQQRLSGRGGGMLVAEVSAGEMAALLRSWESSATLATNNGSRTVAIAGNVEELARVLKKLRELDVLAAMVRVDVAAHSAAIDEIMDDLIEAIGVVETQAPTVDVISSVTGDSADWRGVDAGYFAGNLRNPVRFLDATTTAMQRGVNVFVELSAHPILTQAVEQTIKDAGVQAVVYGSMRRGAPEGLSSLNSLVDVLLGP